MSGIKRLAYFLLMLIGLVLSVKLFDIYMNMNFNPNALPSFCNINSYVDCDGVAKTVHSRFLGLPLALWGIFLYLFFMFLTFVDKLKKPEAEKTAITNDGILFCSGMIAGEGIVGILLALLAVFGVDKAIDVSGMLGLSEPVANIASLVVFALIILSVLKFSVWKKRSK